MDERKTNDAYGHDWYERGGGSRLTGAETEASYELAPKEPAAADKGATARADDAGIRTGEDTRVERDVRGRGLGIAALVVALLALFFWPLLLGLAAIVMGYFAFAGGSRALGLWAMGIGALSVIIDLVARFMSPAF
ncbi:MAG: hypothetical protein IMW86_01945 [Hydrogenibacillus sp.]|nr:hypothetical protein [Hydrogenibacillus sp.]